MRTNCSFNLESLGYWNKKKGTANSSEQFSHRELHLARTQVSAMTSCHAAQPTSCECYELYSSQNALGKEKYGQILQFLLNTNYLLCCNYAKITSFFAFRSPLSCTLIYTSELIFCSSNRSLPSCHLPVYQNESSHENDFCLQIYFFAN